MKTKFLINFIYWLLYKYYLKKFELVVVNLRKK